MMIGRAKRQFKSLYPHLDPWFGVRPWKRHSTVLIVSGFVYIGMGLTFGWLPASPSRINGLALALMWVDYPTLGSFFIFAGVLAFISARWPPFSKTWGYMVLTGLSAGWSAVYAMGVIFLNTGVSNLSYAAVWGLIAFLWWAIAGLYNPDDVRAHYAERR